MEQLTIKNNTLSPKETAQYLGISISTLWRFMKRNDFPKPKRLTERTIRFLKSELDVYLQDKGER
jgi:transcriptional regulator, alpA family